ncbi:hypothetical protein VTN77DRAFT_6863 [Rasamsonia byssochlamydoides]|uniref:uncharacterized protein n=1 Tax=Rasamsonia byssochlamydoides TaxID=89139 RepID=UPI0037437348
MGCIVVLCEPMTVENLSNLIREDRQRIKATLNPFGSVLNISDTAQGGIRLFHPSFRDFLLDCRRCPDKQLLRKNICTLRAPGILAEEVERDQIKKFISAEVQYACRYWARHLQQSSICYPLLDKAYTFLKKHLLHWLEVLSLLGRIPEGIQMISALRSVKQIGTHPSFSALIHDAYRFILCHRTTIILAPLQIYCSALVFSPRESIVSRLFGTEIPSWMVIWPAVPDHWGPLQQTLEGHSKSVKSVAFSPNGQLIASASADTTIRIWDAATGLLQRTLQGHRSVIESVSFSPDGGLLASASYDNKTVGLWNVTTGLLIHSLRFNSDFGRIDFMAFSPDVRFLVSGHEDAMDRLWNVATRSLQKTIQRDSLDLPWSSQRAAFSPNSRLLACGFRDGSVQVWDVANGSLQRTLQCPNAGSDPGLSVYSVAFSPDGRLVASSTYDGRLQLWDLATGSLKRTLVTTKKDYPLSGLIKFSPNGQFLFAGSTTNDRARVVAFFDTDRDQSQPVWISYPSPAAYSIAFSPDSKLIAIAFGGLDTATFSLRQTLKGHWGAINSLVISPNGRCIASGAADGTVRLWDITTGPRQRDLVHSEPHQVLIPSPDGQIFASRTDDSNILLWDMATGSLQHVMKSRSPWRGPMVFSPNGQLLAAAGLDAVEIWDTATGSLRHDLSQFLASRYSDVLDDRSVKIFLWQVATGSFYGYIEGESVAFSHDGQLVASLRKGRISFWDVAACSQRRQILGRYPQGTIVSMAFSPDGRRFAAASGQEIFFWDVTTCSLVATWTDPSRQMISIAFSPDGRLLATVDKDKDGFQLPGLQFLDIATRKICKTLREHCGPIIPLVLEPHYRVAPLRVDDRWVMWSGVKTICLPDDSILPLKCVYGNKLVMASESGSLTILQFDERGGGASVYNKSLYSLYLLSEFLL